MNTYIVELNASEIEAIEVSLCSLMMEMENSIANLKSHNESGINTNKINKKLDCLNRLEDLWVKLQEVQN